jgi:hypothetical protein
MFQPSGGHRQVVHFQETLVQYADVYTEISDTLTLLCLYRLTNYMLNLCISVRLDVDWRVLCLGWLPEWAQLIALWVCAVKHG